MTVPQRRPRRPRPLDAGPFAAEIGSFRLHLAAEGKAARTIRIYTEAALWFAAAHLLRQTGKTRWEQVDGHDVQRWMVRLLARYSDAYASNQYRALQQFFRWLAAEDELPDPMTRLRRAEGHREAGAGVHQRRTFGTGEGLPGPLVRAAPRRRGHRGVHGDRHPAVRAGRDPLRPATTRGAATSTCGAGRSRSAARAAGRGSSRSATRPPAASTGTSASGPGMRRPGGRSCGWG